MGEHTKGEWIVGAYSSIVGLPIIAQPDETKNSVIICVVRGERGEAEANASLIVAGPKLVAALKKCITLLEMHGVIGSAPNGVMAQAQAALSAASGRAPTNKEE